MKAPPDLPRGEAFVSPIVLCRRICAFESGVKVVIGVIAHFGELVVRVICIVDSYHNFIITTFGNVPADLRSAGIEYKDLLTR